VAAAFFRALPLPSNHQFQLADVQSFGLRVSTPAPEPRARAASPCVTALAGPLPQRPQLGANVETQRENLGTTGLMLGLTALRRASTWIQFYWDRAMVLWIRPQFGPKLPLDVHADAARAASHASGSRNFAGIASADDLLPSQRTRCQPLLELLSMTPRRCLQRT
jgi:hypothetical protein